MNNQPNDDTKLITEETKNLSRINKSVHPAFYNVFKDELKNNSFLTTDVRKRIVDRWMKITPLINSSALRQYLFTLEQRYWASIPAWESKALQSKITSQSMVLQERVLEANAQEAGLLIKKARLVDQLNNTVAKVNKLIDTPPAATFVINTGLNDEQMAMDMNAIDAEIIEEEEEDV